MSSHSRIAILAIIFAIFIVLILYYSSSNGLYEDVNKKRIVVPLESRKFENASLYASTCYKPSKDKKSIDFLGDIQNSVKQPTTGKAIFFHETTCSDTGIVKLNSKQACAIESAARHNPKRDIFVLFASPVGVRRNEPAPVLFNILQKYPNIQMRNMDLWRYTSNTPIESWMKSGKLFESAFLSEHMSDIFRSITLYKFGGYYLDLDVVVQKNFDELGEDFLGDDWNTVINGAVMHFNNFGIGRQILLRFFEEVETHFNGNGFIENGPEMFTRICAEICSTDDRTLWNADRCAGFSLQPKETFYPVSWGNYQLYFDPKYLNETLKLTENATLIHVWNDLSKDIWREVGTNNAYQWIAEHNCPLVYKSSKIF